MFARLIRYNFFTNWKRKSIWVIFGLMLVYILLYFYLLPWAVGLSPEVLWDTWPVIHCTLCVVMFALLNAILIVALYKDSGDSGEDLILCSKPVRRTINMFAKLIVYLVFLSIILLGCFLLIFLTLPAFGQYTPLNQTGVHLNTILEEDGDFVLTAFIISLVFFGIGLFISMLSNKIGIILGCVGVSLASALLANISHELIDSELDKISSGGDVHPFTLEIPEVQYQSHESLVNQTVPIETKSYMAVNTYLGEKTILQRLDDINMTGAKIMSTVDVGNQWNNLFHYHSETRDQKTASYGFGANASYKYTIDKNKAIANSSEYSVNDNMPLGLPSSSSSSSSSNVTWSILTNNGHGMIAYPTQNNPDNTILTYSPEDLLSVNWDTYTYNKILNIEDPDSLFYWASKQTQENGFVQPSAFSKQAAERLLIKKTDQETGNDLWSPDRDVDIALGINVNDPISLNFGIYKLAYLGAVSRISVFWNTDHKNVDERDHIYNIWNDSMPAQNKRAWREVSNPDHLPQDDFNYYKYDKKTFELETLTPDVAPYIAALGIQDYPYLNNTWYPFTIEPYTQNIEAAIFWSLFGVLMSGLSLYVYLRKDIA